MPEPDPQRRAQRTTRRGDQLEALSQKEIAALGAACVLDVAAHDADPDNAVPITGWRVPDLGQAPAFGVPAFHGLTPRLAAVLVTRYSRPGQLVLDLAADLAAEGVAGASARRYAHVHPAAAGILVDAPAPGPLATRRPAPHPLATPHLPARRGTRPGRSAGPAAGRLPCPARPERPPPHRHRSGSCGAHRRHAGGDRCGAANRPEADAASRRRARLWDCDRQRHDRPTPAAASQADRPARLHPRRSR